MHELSLADLEKCLLSRWPRVVADAADTSIVGVARLRGTAVPSAASPGAVAADSADARVGRLARNRAATIPTLAAMKGLLSAQILNQ